MKNSTKGRKLSPITTGILGLKKAGQKFVAPASVSRVILGSYVYNANQRMGYNNLFSTAVEKIKGRKRAVVVRNAIAA